MKAPSISTVRRRRKWRFFASCRDLGTSAPISRCGRQASTISISTTAAGRFQRPANWSSAMTGILVLAGKEFRDGLRNKWVAGATLLLAALAFALTFLVSSPTGLLDVKPLAGT